jgi:hypothetical protein
MAAPAVPSFVDLYNFALARSTPFPELTNFYLTDINEENVRNLFYYPLGSFVKILLNEVLTLPAHQQYLDIYKKYKDLNEQEFYDTIKKGTKEVLDHEYPLFSSEMYESINIKDTFLRHYNNVKDLILAGPPNANKHTINHEEAEIWINSQYSEERKRLARIVVENARYISHTEFLEGIQKSISNLIEKYDSSKPVILIVGSSRKSNYYVSLLFAHFWISRGQRLDYILQDFKTATTLNIRGNVLDIDDMGYSGSQTLSVLAGLYTMLRKLIINYFQDKIHNKEVFDFFPDFLLEYVSKKIGFNYFLIRIFTSSKSISLWSDRNYGVKIPCDIIISEIITTIEETVGEKNTKKIQALFENDLSTTFVYFDHKIADSASTLLHPYAFGLIPTNVRNPDIANNNLAINSRNKIRKFHPFINGCLYKDGRSELSNIVLDEDNDMYRCPLAWYKSINYDAPGGTGAGAGASGGMRKTMKRKNKRRITRRR